MNDYCDLSSILDAEDSAVTKTADIMELLFGVGKTYGIKS